MIKRLQKSYKVEINPNNKQKIQLNKTFGCRRYVYNWCVAKFKESAEDKSYTHHYDYINEIVRLKNNDEEYDFLKEVSAVALQQGINDFGESVASFFKKISGFPKFKSKSGKQSFRICNNPRKSIRTFERKIWIPKLGWTKIKGKPEKYLPQGYTIKNITVSKDVDRYFVSILYDNIVLFDDDIEKVGITGVVGIDLGVKYSAIMSYGVGDNAKVRDGLIRGLRFPNPKHMRKHQGKLAIAQQKLSKKKKGSKKYNKQKTKVAKIHRKVRNCRKDYIHKLTNYITTRTKGCVIMMEDLDTCGMLQKNHRAMSRYISDVGFHELFRQFDYKANRNGSRVDKVPKYYPSTKKCCTCGSIKELELSERRYFCLNEECALPENRRGIRSIDRDFNAAINIRNYYFDKVA